MDISARKRKSAKFSVKDNALSVYTDDLNMYAIPPTGDITLEEFQNLAFERLQLLRVLEQASLKGFKLYSTEWKKCVKDDLSRLELRKFTRLMNGLDGQTEQDFQARRADHFSHFILRLACSRTSELRRWFLNRELEWFKLRFLEQNHNTLMRFFETNNLTYTSISEDEKNEILNELIMSTANMNDAGIRNSTFFRVCFSEVCSLVKNRKVFLKDGVAYVPSNELIVCVLTKFRAKLNQSLARTNSQLPFLDDDRLMSFLSEVTKAYIGKDYTVSNDLADDQKIDLHNLDSASKQHFPMCMRYLHETIRATHHLKHFGRLQYGLFLKGIGLRYEEALQFWREEFTKTMDEDKFNKNYLYNVKHAYGMVGSRINYTPHSCMKIITQSVGSGENHGCPFKHWDAVKVHEKLLEHGVPSEGREEIVNLMKNAHYQIACTKYFTCTHSNKPPSITINHPNQYVEESIKLSSDKQNEN